VPGEAPGRSLLRMPVFVPHSRTTSIRILVYDLSMTTLSFATQNQTTFKKAWATALRKAGVAYFRLYDVRSTYATRLSTGGVGSTLR
jgi:integrase